MTTIAHSEPIPPLTPITMGSVVKGYKKKEKERKKTAGEKDRQTVSAVPKKQTENAKLCQRQLQRLLGSTPRSTQIGRERRQAGTKLAGQRGTAHKTVHCLYADFNSIPARVVPTIYAEHDDTDEGSRASHKLSSRQLYTY